MASYPSAVKSFTTKSDGAGNTIFAAHVNDLQDEVAAIEGGLLNGFGHDLKFTDATYDIGKSGATRPRDLFLSRNATIGGTATVAGVLTATSSLVVTAGQITFPATQNAAAGANTLDDYEEIAWTPGLLIGGSTAGITYSVQAGLATKIGRVVVATGAFLLTAKGSSTGAVQIGGLPYSIANVNGAHTGVTFGDYSGWNSSSVTGPLSGYPDLSNSVINLTRAGAGAAVNLSDTDVSTASLLKFSIVYHTVT